MCVCFPTDPGRGLYVIVTLVVIIIIYMLLLKNINNSQPNDTKEGFPAHLHIHCAPPRLRSGVGEGSMGKVTPAATNTSHTETGTPPLNFFYFKRVRMKENDSFLVDRTITSFAKHQSSLTISGSAVG